jgi:hypothetical protein
MLITELKDDKPTPVYTITAIVGTAIAGFIFFGDICLANKGLLSGFLLNCLIGFCIGFTIGSVIHFVRKEIRTEKQRILIKSYDKRAVEKYKNKDYYGVIKELESALLADYTNAQIHFNLACMYSQLKNKQKSFEHLSYAAKFKDENLREKILKNNNLAFVRRQLDFENFLASTIKK